MKRISVVIPTYCNDERYGLGRLYLTLFSLSQQTLILDAYEIIVVDDGSQWDINSLVTSWQLKADIKVIRQPHAGMCTAYRAGIQQARAPLLFLGIDDSIARNDLLEKHVCAHINQEDVVVWGREYHMRQMKKSGSQVTLLPHESMEKVNSLDGNLIVLDKEITEAFSKIVSRSEIIEKYKDIESLLKNPEALKNVLRPGWLCA